MLRSIPGVAEINTQGGYAREYQVLVNPERLRHYQINLHEVYQALARNNANSGGGQLPSYAERYLIRGLGLITKPEDIGKIILKEVKGIPVYGIYPYPITADELTRMHGNDEQVSVDSLKQGTEMIYETLKEVAARR